LSSKDKKSRDGGSKIIVGGLFLQMIFFGVFVLAASLFHKRMNKGPTGRAMQVPWQKHMRALYVISILIIARSIFRIVEFIQGFDGYLIRHEVYVYIFDAVLMLIAMGYMNWVHPSEIKMLLKGGKAMKNGFSMQEMQV
jgi:high-affinity Fe2+/Pb2+ permease